MIKVYRMLLIFAGVFSLAGWQACKKDDVAVNDERRDRIASALQDIQEDLEVQLGYEVPPVSVLIQDAVATYFVTTAKAGQPMTSMTYYRFASNTKNITSAAILNMYEDGWLDYNALITDTIPGSDSTYVPAYRNFPYRDRITIAQLLNHSAGVFDIDNDNIHGDSAGLSYTETVLESDPDHQFTYDELIGVLQANNLSYFEPGMGYHYSNTGYTILAEIIERVYSVKANAPKRYSDYLQDYLFGPGGREPLDIRFPYLATDQQLPAPYMTGKINEADKVTVTDRVNVSQHVAEGNAVTTMQHLNTYIRRLMKGESFLEPGTVQIMTGTTSLANPNYGLGTTYTPNLGYGHNGATSGYLSLMAYDPETDVSLVVTFPLWDLRSDEHFGMCFNTLYNAAYAAREALGYPGKP